MFIPRDILWSDGQKAYRMYGQFSSVVLDSGKFNGGGLGVEALTRDLNGNAIAAGLTSAGPRIVKMQGRFSTTMLDEIVPPCNNPNTLTVDRDGDIWIAGRDDTYIYWMAGFTTTIRHYSDNFGVTADAITTDHTSLIASYNDGMGYQALFKSEVLRDTPPGYYDFNVANAEEVCNLNALTYGNIKDATWDGTNLIVVCELAGVNTIYTFDGLSTTVLTYQEMTGKDVVAIEADNTPARLEIAGGDPTVKGDVIWSGKQDGICKLYRTSGQFSTTMHDSIELTGGGLNIMAQNVASPCWDGVNTCIGSYSAISGAYHIFKIKGQFDSQVLQDQVLPAGVVPNGVETYGDDTLICSNLNGRDKIYWLQGRFTSNIIGSMAVTVIEGTLSDLTFDGLNVIWGGRNTGKIFRMDGILTTKILQSIAHHAGCLQGVSWDGTNLVILDGGASLGGNNKAWQLDGQFRSIVYNSIDFSPIDTLPEGLTSTEFEARLPQEPPSTKSTVISGTSGKLQLLEGQFSTVVLKSYQFNAPLSGIDWDGEKLYLASPTGGLFRLQGIFSSMMDASVRVASIDRSPTDATWDGENKDLCFSGKETRKLYKLQGTSSSIIVSSIAVEEAFPEEVTPNIQGYSWVTHLMNYYATDNKLHQVGNWQYETVQPYKLRKVYWTGDAVSGNGGYLDDNDADYSVSAGFTWSPMMPYALDILREIQDNPLVWNPDVAGSYFSYIPRLALSTSSTSPLTPPQWVALLDSVLTEHPSDNYVLFARLDTRDSTNKYAGIKFYGMKYDVFHKTWSQDGSIWQLIGSFQYDRNTNEPMDRVYVPGNFSPAYTMQQVTMMSWVGGQFAWRNALQIHGNYIEVTSPYAHDGDKYINDRHDLTQYEEYGIHILPSVVAKSIYHYSVDVPSGRQATDIAYDGGLSYDGIVPWSGKVLETGHSKLFRNAGPLSSVVNTSLDIHALETDVTGLASTSAQRYGILTVEVVSEIAFSSSSVPAIVRPDVMWSNNNKTIYRLSSCFSSVIRDVFTLAESVGGMAWDGEHLAHINKLGRMMLRKLPFSSTTVASHTWSSGETTYRKGITLDLNDTWVSTSDPSRRTIYKLAGQFSSTVLDQFTPAWTTKDLESTIDDLMVSDAEHIYRVNYTTKATIETWTAPFGNENIQGIAFDGAKTLWQSANRAKMYLNLGRVSTTILTSMGTGMLPGGGTPNGLTSLSDRRRKVRARTLTSGIQFYHNLPDIKNLGVESSIAFYSYGEYERKRYNYELSNQISFAGAIDGHYNLIKIAALNTVQFYDSIVRDTTVGGNVYNISLSSVIAVSQSQAVALKVLDKMAHSLQFTDSVSTNRDTANVEHTIDFTDAVTAHGGSTFNITGENIVEYTGEVSNREYYIDVTSNILFEQILEKNAISPSVGGDDKDGTGITFNQYVDNELSGLPYVVRVEDKIEFKDVAYPNSHVEIHVSDDITITDNPFLLNLSVPVESDPIEFTHEVHVQQIPTIHDVASWLTFNAPDKPTETEKPVTCIRQIEVTSQVTFYNDGYQVFDYRVLDTSSTVTFSHQVKVTKTSNVGVTSSFRFYDATRGLWNPDDEYSVKVWPTDVEVEVADSIAFTSPMYVGENAAGSDLTFSDELEYDVATGAYSTVIVGHSVTVGKELNIALDQTVTFGEKMVGFLWGKYTQTYHPWGELV